MFFIIFHSFCKRLNKLNCCNWLTQIKSQSEMILRPLCLFVYQGLSFQNMMGSNCFTQFETLFKRMTKTVICNIFGQELKLLTLQYYTLNALGRPKLQYYPIGLSSYLNSMSASNTGSYTGDPCFPQFQFPQAADFLGALIGMF